MKQLEIKTNKRHLIVEYETEAELAVDFALMKAFKNPKVMKFGLTLKPICKGSDLTEEVAEDLVEILWKGFKNYNEKEPVGNYQRFVVKNALEAFISAIESKGCYWGENPLQKTKPTSDLSFYESEEDYEIALAKWKEAESWTFHPEKCIIFEIV